VPRPSTCRAAAPGAMPRGRAVSTFSTRGPSDMSDGAAKGLPGRRVCRRLQRLLGVGGHVGRLGNVRSIPGFDKSPFSKALPQLDGFRSRRATGPGGPDRCSLSSCVAPWRCQEAEPASWISQYFKARLARAAQGELPSTARYRRHHSAASAYRSNRWRNRPKLNMASA
jgi:hypothetical protein